MEPSYAVFGPYATSLLGAFSAIIIRYMKKILFALLLAISLGLSVAPGMVPSAYADCISSASRDEPLLKKTNCIQLLQSLGPKQVLPPAPDIQIFFDYFSNTWPWVLGVAAGIGVLQSLVGGVEIMMSGSDSGMREGGKSKIMWALAGLLMVGLAGFILRSLNPIFYN